MAGSYTGTIRCGRKAAYSHGGTIAKRPASGRSETARPGQPKHVCVVGLGIGTLATYGQPGDRYRLYEINPEVVQMAREHFTYLKDCTAQQTLVVRRRCGLNLEFSRRRNSTSGPDAFSGDAVPVHLLTKEAMSVYLKHLKGGRAAGVSHIDVGISTCDRYWRAWDANSG